MQTLACFGIKVSIDVAGEDLLSLATDFVRGGGTFSLVEWGNLSPTERSIFAQAGDAVRHEDLGLLVQGIGDPVKAAALFGTVEDVEEALLDTLEDQTKPNESAE